MERKGSVLTLSIVFLIAGALVAAPAVWAVPKTYVITSTATPMAGGTIDPKGRVIVQPTGSQTFTIAPNTAYYISDVQVDRVSVGTPTAHTFNNVTANHAIKATFKIKTYTVTATAGAKGKILPAGAKTVNYGKFINYTATPAKGFKAGIKVDGMVVIKGAAGKAVKYKLENIMANHTVEAVFFTGDLMLPLTVAKSGSGSGTVTSFPDGINCGVSCTADFSHNSAVTLTAIPDGASAFAGWSGSGCSGTGTCDVTMSGNEAVTAHFVLRSRLTVTRSGNGSGVVTSAPDGIDCGSHCSEVYDAGTVITLTALPEAGSGFAGWTDGGCSGKGTCQVSLAADTTVDAYFSRPESDITITIIGLGQSIKVTNTSPVTIQGLASAGSGINGVSWENETTGGKGTCAGTTLWSQAIPLNQGDNKLKFTAHANDGSSVAIDTTLTFEPALTFSTPLTFSKETIYIGEKTDAGVTIGLIDTAGVTVTLVTADEEGATGPAAGQMLDDGVLPDEIQQDGIYTTRISFNPTSEGYLCYRAAVSKEGNTYYSETKCLWATNHVMNQQIDTAVNLANWAQETYDALTAQGMLDEKAAFLTAETLVATPGCGTAGTNGQGGVWWVTTDGILGLLHPFLDDEKAGSRRLTRHQGEPRPGKTPEGPAGRPTKTGFYPYEYLMDRSQYVPQNLRRDHSKQFFVAETRNEIKSPKGIIISPYINNPDTTANFGNHDDYHVIWKLIKDKKACRLQATTEKLNNGAVTIGINDFKSFGEYGYIHISTHGDNVYNGLANGWKNEWGPKGWLQGALSQGVLLPGIYLKKNGDGSWKTTDYEEDLKEKRIAIRPNAGVALLPSFFAYYLDRLPNSLVVLSACRSQYNDSLANAFLAKGAGALLGYTDYVKMTYAQNTLKKVVEEMFQGKSVSEAVVLAINAFGANDGDGTPAALVHTGATNLLLSSGKLWNGDFEEGAFHPWKKAGDGRIITRLGQTSPTSGAYMGIVSTGLGYTTLSGSLSQDICATPQIDKMTFSWNYFSEEFKEYCGFIYQDTFAVDLCEIDDAAGGTTCSTVFSRTVDSLCSSVTKSDVSFDRGDVYNTGWQGATIDMSPYADKHVQLIFRTYDMGDSIYDTAVLIDNIQITETGPAP